MILYTDHTILFNSDIKTHNIKKCAVCNKELLQISVIIILYQEVLHDLSINLDFKYTQYEINVF